jgi:citrate lyase subunit beta/citryl-CoA lyase
MNKSYLMVAGDKIKHLEKLNDLQCDVAIINLEDGVYDKQLARKLVYDYLSKHIINKPIVIRVNSLKTCGIDDIKLLNTVKPYAIRVPKIEIVEDVQKCLELIHKNIEVHLSIETAKALENLKTFKIHKRVTNVYLGILDLLETLGLPQNLLVLNNPSIEYILSKFLIESKSASLNPVSFVYQNYQNLDVFTLWCKKEKEMGFISKVCISPKQVNIVNEIYKQDSNEIHKAKIIIELFEKNKALGVTGFSHNEYGFIDEPIYKDAKQIISKI